MSMCTKFHVDFLKKLLSSAVLSAEKGHFYGVYANFGGFPIFKFCSISAVQKLFNVYFRSWRKSDIKTCTYNTNQTQNYKFDLFDLLTLHDLDTTSQKSNEGT